MIRKYASADLRNHESFCVATCRHEFTIIKTDEHFMPKGGVTFPPPPNNSNAMILA